MDIYDATVQHEGIAEDTVTRVLRSGGVSRSRAAIQEESLVDFYVNGTLMTTFGCTVSNLDELAVGHLCTEGIVSRFEDVRRLCVDVGSSRINADVDSIDGRPIMPLPAIEWKLEAVFRIADEFALDKTAHARTRGAHSAFLCDLDGHILCMREDIGRHNAFDKVVGWSLLNGVDLERCMLYTSGRVPSDMAMKAIRARIPVLVSKSVATDRGIALARAYGLTLICEARPLQFDVVNG